jgi:hypothetical protein
MSLNLAWLHSVVTHSFSLPACWLWQVRSDFEDGKALRERLVPIVLYILAALLYFSVTLALLLREKIRHALPAVAATAFALVNAALLFDQARADFGVELALSAASATQLFSLYAFLVYSAHRQAKER